VFPRISFYDAINGIKMQNAECKMHNGGVGKADD